MRELAQKARAETENLENHLRERAIELEGHKKEIETLKTEKHHLNHKVSEVLSSETTKINLARYFTLLWSNFSFISNVFSVLSEVT